MKIIDILKQTAEMLFLTDVVEKLNTATEENETEITTNAEVSSLISLFKYSMQELCTNYVPISTILDVEIVNSKYELANLHNYVRVQGVYRYGQPVNYKILNRAIVVEEDGIYSIKYATYPEVVSIFEEIDYLSSFSPDVLVLALASYYTLSRGRFEEFEIVHKKYIEKAESLKELKTLTIPQRRWE